MKRPKSAWSFALVSVSNVSGLFEVDIEKRVMTRHEFPRFGPEVRILPSEKRYTCHDTARISEIWYGDSYLTQ